MTLAFCPSFAHVEDAVQWFEDRGYAAPMLWRGPDGLVRGSAKMRSSYGMCSKKKHPLTLDNIYREPSRRSIHCVACRRERQHAVRMKTCGKCGQSGHNRRSCR